MKITLRNSITYGIGTDNRWGILQRSGNPKLRNLRTEQLIAENLEYQDSPADAIAKFVGDGYGKYGISITLTSESKPVTYATVLDNDMLENILLAPSYLVEAFRDYFHIDIRTAKNAFGYESSSLLSNDLYSKLVQLSARGSFRRSSISIGIPEHATEIGGMFGLLRLIWNLLPDESRTGIFAIYPVKVDGNARALLLSSRRVHHASIALASATNFYIRNYYGHIVKLQYLSIFDFLRSLWPF